MLTDGPDIHRVSTHRSDPGVIEGRHGIPPASRMPCHGRPNILRSAAMTV